MADRSGFSVAPRKSIQGDKGEFLHAGSPVPEDFWANGVDWKNKERDGFIVRGHVSQEPVKPGQRLVRGDQAEKSQPKVTNKESIWDHDPEDLKDKDREDLVVMIHELDPEFNDFEISREDAIAKLCREFKGN